MNLCLEFQENVSSRILDSMILLPDRVRIMWIEYVLVQVFEMCINYLCLYLKVFFIGV